MKNRAIEVALPRTDNNAGCGPTNPPLAVWLQAPGECPLAPEGARPAPPRQARAAARGQRYQLPRGWTVRMILVASGA